MPGTREISGLSRLGAALFATVLPPGCPGCGQPPAPGHSFCAACAGSISLASDHACPICGRALPPDQSPAPCAICRRQPPPFAQARALADYAGPVARALRSFKYHRRLDAGAALAALALMEAPADWLEKAEVMAPVPLHPWRLLKRGFNQALVLFTPLARECGLELAPGLLRRRRHTRPQVGLSPQDRRDNVADAFSLGRGGGKQVAGRRVLIVDDVFTTGATAGECARVLAQAGAASVSVLALARAVGRPSDDAAPLDEEPRD